MQRFEPCCKGVCKFRCICTPLRYDVTVTQRSKDARSIAVVLSLVEELSLFSMIKDKLLIVASVDTERAVTLIVDNYEQVRLCVCCVCDCCDCVCAC